jgi:hypothetical protein
MSQYEVADEDDWREKDKIQDEEEEDKKEDDENQECPYQLYY